MYNKRTVPVSHCSLFSALVGRERGTCFLSLLAGDREEGTVALVGEAKSQCGGHCGLGSDDRKGKLDWQGHPRRASASNLDLRWALPVSLRLPWWGVLAGRESVLRKAKFGGWQTWVEIPAPSLPASRHSSKSLQFWWLRQ